MRKKYIRFFISSTFEDMKIERNLLQEVFNELIPKYAKTGWQIETIDLRWGITKEAGLDNKTMQICLSELRRCQKLSPKPNFIILMGDRYGWIPLPEIIGQTEIDSLLLNPQEKKLFNDWYKLDENAKPAQYVLQKRTEQYEEKDIWEEKVEKPLGDLFVRHNIKSYGLSATEQEIQEGALNVSDAHEHVLAYIRHLINIPKKDEIIYKETKEHHEQQRRKLERTVRSKLSQTNLYTIDSLDFVEYEAQKFKHDFKTEIKKKIELIINPIVKQNQINDIISEESEAHNEIKRKEASNFVRRFDIIEEIDNYITNTDEHRALHIMSPSGFGKTALLSKIATKFEGNHRVICCFCGQTNLSSEYSTLFETLIKRISISKPANRQTIRIRNTWSFIQALNDYSKLSEEGSLLPLLVIIDGINQIGSKDLLDLKWIGTDLLPNNVKVIFSSTDELKYHYSRKNVTTLSLPNMGDDSWNLVVSVLDNNKRCLTIEQQKAVKIAIDVSDKSAIYLHVLGLYLSRKHSWQKLDYIPTNLEELVKAIINDIYKTGHYNKRFVNEVLSLLCIERIGLSQEEILDLVSANKDVFENLKKNSHHEIIGQRVPTALWSRLYNALSPFIIMYQYPKIGNVITVYHQALKNEILSFILPASKEKAEISLELYNYYSKKLYSKDAHSLSELVYQGYVASQNFTSTDATKSNLITETLYRQLTSIEYIIPKLHILAPTFFSDYNLAERLYKQEIRQKFFLIKDESVEALKRCHDEEQYLLYFRALPSNFVLRKIVDNVTAISPMENCLSETTPYTRIIHAINELGEEPRMSEDGNIVASLVDNRHKIVIQDLQQNTIRVQYTLQDEIRHIEFDDSFRYNVIKTDDNIFFYDNQENKTIIRLSNKEVIWYSLSKKNPLFVIGLASAICIFHTDGKEDNYDISSIAGSVSASGQYLWFITNDYRLHRIEVNSGITLSFGMLEKIKNHKPIIIGCSDEWCACVNKETIIFRHYLTKEGKNNYNIIPLIWDRYEIITFSPDEEKLFTYTDGLYEIFAWKELNDAEASCCSIDRNHIHNLCCINRDMTYALVRNTTSTYICDFQNETNIYTTSKGGNDGINMISCSYDGEEIILSSGINPYGRPGDRNPDAFRISNGIPCRWNPSPKTNDDIVYIAGNAVSPNKSTIAISILQGEEDNELLFIDSKKKYSITTAPTKKECCTAMTFSPDSKYLVALTGFFICNVGSLYLLDNSGNVIQKHDMENSTCCFSRNIRFSIDDRYALATGDGNVAFYDCITQEDLFIKENFQLHNMPLYKGFCFKSHECIVQLPFGNHILVNDDKGLLYSINLKERTYKNTGVTKTPIGCSSTGRYIFFLEYDVLSMGLWPLDEPFEDILSGVKWIVPAHDEDHIFVMKTNNLILLYNIKKRSIEQKAYFGLAVFQKLCAKGLVVAEEGSGKVALFHPDAQYHVNIPAVTTFVRHWNLKTKSLEPPTAICPMCGNEIQMSSDLKCILKKNPIIEIPDKYKFEHWDNRKLFGYKCTKCKSELRYNPYIINETEKMD